MTMTCPMCDGLGEVPIPVWAEWRGWTEFRFWSEGER